MTQLSICIPSNRNLQNAQASIETALTYAQKADCRVVISDNSGDAAKRAHFESRSDRLTYLVPEGDDPVVNMMTALSHVQTPFVMPMGDDDEIYLLDGVRRMDLSGLPADFVGVRPRSYTWTYTHGVRQTDCFPIVSDNAGQRLLEYNAKARGNNNFYYSAYRTDVFRGLCELFVHSHPTKGGYCDWALSSAFAASGKFQYDPATIYRYDLGRWSSTDDIEQSKARLFRQAGLPDCAEKFSTLLRFVDTHVFLAWIGLPLPADERDDAMAANARFLVTFVKEVEQAPEAYDEDVRYLCDLVRETSEVSTAFQLALLVLDRLVPGLSTRYVDFYNASQRTAA